MSGTARKVIFGAVIVAVLAVVAVKVVNQRAGNTTRAELSGQALLEARCGSCHQSLGDGQGLDRIATLRKTPEGWDMTLARMTIWHQVTIDPDERVRMVKYLADTQGLAPVETALYRYALERDLNRIEDFPSPELQVQCGRCHTYARVGLQRRDEDEWLKLVHTHLGQWPGIEHQPGANGRSWWDVAREQTVAELGDMYPLETDAWTDWQAVPRADLAGTWRVSGERPGTGRYQGSMEITALGGDHYSAHYDLVYQDGVMVEGVSDAVVYTGYEWRGSATIGSEQTLEVFALSESGEVLSGRWFLAQDEGVGASFKAYREGGPDPLIVAVEPPYLRTGEEAEITVHGIGLVGPADFGADVEIIAEVARSPRSVTLRVRAAPDATEGRHTVSVGEARGAASLILYYNIDAVRIEPAEAIARIGGGGGALAPVTAQFKAVAYVNGPDGRAGTGDDVAIGTMPATWAVDNFNQAAVQDQDAAFAGIMGENGHFTPATAGVNPARDSRGISMNNVGNLRVIGTIDDGGRGVRAEAHMIVTVQRWNSPPIR